MVGAELAAGVVAGVAQAAAPALMEAPVVVARSVAPAIGTLAQAPISMGASVLQAAPGATGEIAGAVTNGLSEALSSVESLVPLGNTPPSASNTLFVAKLDILVAKGDHSSALRMLAFGDIANGPKPMEFSQEELARPLSTLVSDLQSLGPKGADTILQAVGNTDVPQELQANPEFLAQFMSELQKNTAGPNKGTNQQEAFQRAVQESTQAAVKQTKTDLPGDDEKEKLKRESAKKAALLAIRALMDRWRVDVLKDKRLTPEAKQVAYKKIGLVERKLMITEVIKWDGISVQKLLALAVVWMQQIQDDSLPDPAG